MLGAPVLLFALFIYAGIYIVFGFLLGFCIAYVLAYLVGKGDQLWNLMKKQQKFF
jgi:hypothetical protein